MKHVRLIRKLCLLMGILLFGILGVTQQKTIAQTVTGTVVSAEDNLPLPGVNVVIKGSTTGTITDLNGKYNLDVPDLNTTLEFSFIGYKEQEVPLNGRSTIDITLEVETEEMEEVVVIGYGTVKKGDLTGAVAVVSEEDLTRTPASSLSKALQGKASGVMVMQSGEPGAGVNIRVRGIGSINKNPNPLYVIDGVVGADINTIAPEDIKSLQVLKDASASAIYGADGANGVVIVTTKRGQAGRTKVSFSSYWGTQRMPQRYDLMNANQYAAFYDTMAIMNNVTPDTAYSDAFRQYYYGDGWQEGTDWQDAILQDNFNQNYHLNISGGNENANFSVSANYYNETGVLINTGMERYSLRINSDFKIGKYIRVGESVGLSRRIRQKSEKSSFEHALESSPLMRIYNKDNKEGFEGAQIPIPFTDINGEEKMVNNTGGNDKFNPVGECEVLDDKEYDNDLIGNLYLEIKPFDWLSFKSTPAVRIGTDQDRTWTPSYEMGVRSHSDAVLEQEFKETVNTSIKNQITINKSFGNHNLNVIAVHHARQGYNDNAKVNAMGFPYEDLNVISQSATDGRTVQGTHNPWSQLSYIGRVMYNYDSKYLFTASIRQDGSSNFGEENRWGTFPAFSAAWKINEDLFPDFEPISMMKIRAGWGKTGNSNIGAFQYQNQLSKPSDFHVVLGADQTTVPALNELYKIGNPLIKWEAADMTNVGVDITLYDGKIQASAEYFMKNQDDLLIQVPVSGILGKNEAAEPWMNIAKIKNTGFEFDVRYSRMEGAFNYNINANISTVKNSVIEIPEQIRTDNNITTENHTIGSLYGYVAEGIIQEDDFDEEGNYKYAVPSEGVPSPGDLRFKDLNRDGEITDLDRTIIGKAFPDFAYSLSFEGFYKDFDFSIFLFGMHNYQVINHLNKQIYCFDRQDMDHNKAADWAENYYRPWQPTTDYLRADINDQNQNTRTSTWWLEQASFLRIKDLQVGYTLPRKALNYLGLSSLRLYVSLANLYTFTKYSGYDPESPISGGDDPLERGNDNNAYPLPRTYTGGIQINF